ncbi:hypothetical protein BC941DRAFT_473150 [Chlamydoabsidia padenii]|nr:hypothetical protein BC941DRAFT_473150 [Chlamydoabsidia padenii]
MDSSLKQDHHHAGMKVHPTYNDYIPNTKEDQPTSYSANQPRKRTRATPEQLSILEKTFSVNPSPNNRVREQLSRELGMSERSIQIWFQNRRAKVKNMAKRSSLLHDETMRMQYYAATAAAAACQSQQQQHTSPDGTPISNTDLYYYYYYYYYNQQQQQQGYYSTDNMTSLKPQATPPPPPPPPPMPTAQTKPWTSLSTPPPSSISPSLSTPISVYQPNLGTPTLPVNTNVNDTAAGGRIRSHSVGHYPYNPYQRRSNDGYTSRRHYSTSASPAPMWPSSSIMLGPNGGMIPEEVIGFNHQHSTWSSVEHGMMPTSLPLVQDERLGTPMSMDEYATTTTIGGGEEDEINHHRISVEALQIGTWKRMSLQAHDLECFYDQQLRCMVWRIQDGLQRFKMHIKLDSIEKIRLDPLLERLGWARLSLTVIQPETICFYMEEGYASECWTQCRDFTQDRQATTVHTHYIDGPALALRAEWIRLVAHDQQLQNLVQNNMIQQHVINNQMYHTARGPHGQSMLSNSSREVTPADMMMVLQQQENQSMLSLMEKDQDKDQDLLLFQGV